jgi:hypothetical protein
VPSGKRGGGPSGTALTSAGLLAPPLPAGEVLALGTDCASSAGASALAVNAANRLPPRIA